VEEDERLAGFFAADFDVLPAELGADAGAEGFGHGFFGGKAGGEKWGGVFVGEAVSDFGGVENAFEEAGAMSLVGGGDALDFDDVYAGA
jgi:hypothetical protein